VLFVEKSFYRVISITCLLVLIFISNPSLADLVGEKGVYLVDKMGGQQRVATISLKPKGKGYLYTLNLDTEHFEDQFLSMRPFKCLMGGEQVVCYVEYPYINQRYIEEDDLTSLEYDLLFLHKSPTEYGINLWNGIYYKLHFENEEISGQLYELDMNLLSAPPEEGIIRPITGDDIFEGDVDNQRFPELLIK
jgi:hypothetical protein